MLVVGVGNSGADIGIEVAASHPTWIAGKESGHIPWPIETFTARVFLVRLVRFLGHHVLTVKRQSVESCVPSCFDALLRWSGLSPKTLTQPESSGCRSWCEGRTAAVGRRSHLER